MVDVAQLVRASDCGSEGRRFETGLPPKKNKGPLIPKGPLFTNHLNLIKKSCLYFKHP